MPNSWDVMRNDCHISKITVIFYRKRKSHQKGDWLHDALLTATTTISKICQEFWLQNIDFRTTIKFTNGKNMSLFTPGRFYSCKLSVKDRGCDISCKALYEPERPQGEKLNRKDFAKSQDFLILRLKSQAPQLEQRWWSCQQLCDQAEVEGAVFVLRDLLQLAVFVCINRNFQAVGYLQLKPTSNKMTRPSESYAAWRSLNSVAWTEAGQ